MGYQGNYPPSTPLNSTQLGTGVVTTDAIANGAVIPADLSTGGPYWDTSGNVGIGTTSPNGKLHVAGTASSAGWLVEASTTTSAGNASGIYVDASNNVEFAARNGSNTLTLRLGSSGDSYINSGNVGIGTSSPSSFGKFAVTGSGGTVFVGSSGQNLVFTNGGTNYITTNTAGGQFQFQTGAGSNAMLIDSSGRITAPSQPAFNATIPYTSTASLWPDNNANFVNYVSVSLNRGSSFNATTGLFTAPVSGAYRFIAVLSAESTVELNDYQLAVNNSSSENYSTPVVLTAPNPGWKNGTVSSVLNLNANDTVSVRRTCCNNSKPGAFRMTFSGELIG